jgi:hypothetical protein
MRYPIVKVSRKGEFFTLVDDSGTAYNGGVMYTTRERAEEEAQLWNDYYTREEQSDDVD